jgi:ferredoxin
MPAVAPKKIKIELEGVNTTKDVFECEVQKSVSLLEHIENAALRSPFGCRVGTCGTCVVEVLKGAELLEPASSMEEDTLGRIAQMLGVLERSRLRLACRTEFAKEFFEELSESSENLLVLKKLKIV